MRGSQFKHGMMVFALETLRADQRPKEIRKQQKGDDSDNDIFHGSKPPACVGVKNANREERDRCSDEDQVRHGVSSFMC